MPPAAPDSSVEELSGVFMKERHASQNVELHPLHNSLAHTRTHTHCEVASLHTTTSLRREWKWMCLHARSSRNALRNANPNHISIAGVSACAGVCEYFYSWRF